MIRLQIFKPLNYSQDKIDCKLLWWLGMLIVWLLRRPHPKQVAAKAGLEFVSYFRLVLQCFCNKIPLFFLNLSYRSELCVKSFYFWAMVVVLKIPAVGIFQKYAKLKIQSFFVTQWYTKFWPIQIFLKSITVNKKLFLSSFWYWLFKTKSKPKHSDLFINVITIKDSFWGK